MHSKLNLSAGLPPATGNVLAPGLALVLRGLRPRDLLTLGFHGGTTGLLLHCIDRGPSKGVLLRLLASTRYPFQQLYNKACGSQMDFKTLWGHLAEPAREQRLLLHPDCLRQTAIQLDTHVLDRLAVSPAGTSNELPSMTKQSFVRMAKAIISSGQFPSTRCSWLFTLGLGDTAKAVQSIPGSWRLYQPGCYANSNARKTAAGHFYLDNQWAQTTRFLARGMGLSEGLLNLPEYGRWTASLALAAFRIQKQFRHELCMLDRMISALKLVASYSSHHLVTLLTGQEKRSFALTSALAANALARLTRQASPQALPAFAEGLAQLRGPAGPGAEAAGLHWELTLLQLHWEIAGYDGVPEAAPLLRAVQQAPPETLWAIDLVSILSVFLDNAAPAGSDAALAMVRRELARNHELQAYFLQYCSQNYVRYTGPSEPLPLHLLPLLPAIPVGRRLRLAREMALHNQHYLQLQMLKHAAAHGAGIEQIVTGYFRAVEGQLLADPVGGELRFGLFQPEHIKPLGIMLGASLLYALRLPAWFSRAQLGLFLGATSLGSAADELPTLFPDVCDIDAHSLRQACRERLEEVRSKARQIFPYTGLFTWDELAHECLYQSTHFLQ